jgi:cytoskeletal protein RodZ
MKELGEKFKEAREKTGISLEEAAIDLEYKVSQLEEIENGNYKDFKDKFLLKTIISDYAKYLGFDPEEIIDEFNTFVFESTSKIPIDEIAKASKNMNKDTDDQIASPYTATEEPKKVPLIIIISLVVLLIVFLGILCYNLFFKDTGSSSFDVSYLMEVIHENC